MCPSANTGVALADPRVTDGGGWLGIGKVFVEVGIVICIGVKRVALVNGREGVVERGEGVGKKGEWAGEGGVPLWMAKPKSPKQTANSPPY